MPTTSPLLSFEEPIADPSIEDYAAIGDCRTLALVSRFGSIDWWCLPDFAGPSLFAALLDREWGGRFALTPRRIVSSTQAYEEHSNVLRTRYECEGGVLETTDFMGIPEAGPASLDNPDAQRIVRISRCISGRVELQALIQPRPDYARTRARIERLAEGRWHCGAPGCEADVITTIPFEPAPGDALAACVTLLPGERHVVILQAPAAPAQAASSLCADADESLAATLAWWRSWCARVAYQGPYAEAIVRSALALKLLMHQPTGAIVAAGTTSLPEGPIGGRNWDYRFCWLRDSSLVVDAFSSVGCTGESDAFLRWLLHATRRTRPRLQMVYDVRGEPLLPEQVLMSLRGYHGVPPVRIGNAASGQRQHDVYGEVIVAAWDYAERGGVLNPQEQGLIAGFAEEICKIWREPDHGLWEIRLPPRHNTHSKLLCWAGLDRALELHHKHGMKLHGNRCTTERDAIRAEIEANGYNRNVGSYVGFYGSEAADASLLLMPRLGYVHANDPRMVGTVRHILQHLSVDGLLYRYPPGQGYDGLTGPEHLFAICSFWCVDCLARQGRIAEAHAMYEKLLRLRNHAGLYAEEFDVRDGRPMGNFPQAFSHVGAITAALALSTATGGPTAPTRK